MKLPVTFLFSFSGEKFIVYKAFYAQLSDLDYLVNKWVSNFFKSINDTKNVLSLI